MTAATASSLNTRSAGGRRITVIQGDYHVDDREDVVITTLLGSCVAACLFDPLAKIGGLNHFLLPSAPDRSVSANQTRSYGAHAMELLINDLLRRGAARSRLQAKVFGGARMMTGLTDIGEQNAKFIEGFLRDESITMVGGSLRGDQGRRIEFWPVAGRARQTYLTREAPSIFASEVRAPPPAPMPDAGALELF